MLKNGDNIGEYTLQMPTLNSDLAGYIYLADLQNDIKKATDLKQLSVLFFKRDFIEGNLFAVLGAILPNYPKIYFSFKKKFWGLYSIERLLQRNGFLNYYGENHTHDCNDTTIQYKIFKKYDRLSFAKYILTDVFKVGAFPRMSDPAKKKIQTGLLEIFDNSITHGQTDKVFICGQYYPNKGLLKFTLVDLGITIKNNIFYCMGIKFSGPESISWATSDANTTRRGNTPGGLGLKILRKFLKMNGGSLQIVSNDGFWEDSPLGEKKALLPKQFLGTIVTVAVNTNDNKQYKTKDEQRN